MSKKYIDKCKCINFFQIFKICFFFVFINKLVELSIIIVNYNVKYFLEQCLCSVKKAIGKVEAEILVVDNNSTDGSIEYLRPKFSFVQFIINKENLGFSRANNQALALAKGNFILFLNPDTIVGEDSFEKSISFLKGNADAGALGVKMIDGSGNYLKESKRGFPSPGVSFYKLSGLTALFPHSKIFGKYYLGNLSEKENQIIDVIAGAYLFTKKETLARTGGFDEQFFMYAEDIDLSYRIQQAGYKNYFFAETTIIHFKGESTKKDFRYVKLFYKAMSQFAKKHFSKGASGLFSMMIQAAIWLRACISAISSVFTQKTSNEDLHSKSCLFGDAASISHLKALLTIEQRVITTIKSESDEIIFCEGEHFSFKEIIEEMQQHDDSMNKKIHSSNSFSAVGSVSRKKSGEIIVL